MWTNTLFPSSKPPAYFSNAKQAAPDPQPTPGSTLPQFFCLNLLDNYDHPNQLAQTRRADLNITQFSNFLLETDILSYADQDAMLKRLQSLLPPTLATFSGSKSIHLIYALHTPLAASPHTPKGVEAYNRFWTQLACHVEYLLNPSAAPRRTPSIFDRACKNPSRLTRTPGAIRPETGAEQVLLFQGPLLPPATVEEISTLPLEEPGTQAVFTGWADWKFEDFEAFALRRPWGSAFGSAHLWAAPSGMYEEMFRAVLWGIDETGVSSDIFDKFLEKYTYPHLLNAGYPEYKLRKPLQDAYFHKKGSST